MPCVIEHQVVTMHGVMHVNVSSNETRYVVIWFRHNLVHQFAHHIIQAQEQMNWVKCLGLIETLSKQ